MTTTLGPDLDFVRDVAGIDHVSPGRSSGSRSRREPERAAETHPELLVLVLMLRDVTVGIELDHTERDLLAVDDAAVHAVPDPLQVEG